MKPLIALVFLTLAIPVRSQWIKGRGTVQEVGYAVHDTSFFVSGDRFLIRLYPDDQYAQTGLDFTQGNFNTFSSVGQTFLIGGYDDYDDTLHKPNFDKGIGALSSDNGSHWTTVIGGPVGGNGSYFFARRVHHLARSRDNGRTWEFLNDYPSPQSFAGHGALMYMTTSDYWATTESSGLWRSLDSGSTWSHINAPFNGTLVLMRDIVFIYQHYRAHPDIDEPSRNGILIMSRDSGKTWDTVRIDSAGMPEYISALATDGKNLFAGGHNGMTGYGNGVYVSTDTGKTCRPTNEGLTDKLHIEAFGFFDTSVYMSASRDDESFPFGSFRRPLRELVDTTGHNAVQRPSLAMDTILVYPNPSPGLFTIEAPNADIRSITVLNLLGQELVHAQGSGGRDGTLHADLSALAAGTYFLRIETERGVVMRKVVRE